jgi:general secretion pathway protein F
MPEFSYTAVDDRGQKVKGKLTAASEIAAIRELKSTGLTPWRIRATSTSTTYHWLRRGPSTLELASFMEELASLVTAQLPLDEALAITSKSRKSELAASIEAIRMGLREGLSFAATLAKQGTLFPAIAQAMIAAGESSGTLARVLRQLSENMRSNLELKQKLQSALVYPAILTCATFATMAGLVLFLVPRLAPILEQSGKQPPLLIKASLAISGAISSNGLLIAGILLVIMLAIAARWRKPYFEELRERIWLKIPIVGPMLIARETIAVTSTLSLVTSGGVRLAQAMPLAQSASTMRTTKMKLIRAESLLRAGETFHSVCEVADLFTPQTRSLIAAGERAGRLTEMLAHISASESKRLASGIETLTASLGPVLTLLVGLIVGSIAWSVMDALMSMNDIVQ